MDGSLASNKIEADDSLENEFASEKPVNWRLTLTILYVHDGIPANLWVCGWFSPCLWPSPRNGYFNVFSVHSNEAWADDSAFPLFLTMLQMGFCEVALRISGCRPTKSHPRQSVTWGTYLRQTCLPGLLLSGVLIFWNYSYLYQTVAFIQVMKVVSTCS